MKKTISTLMLSGLLLGACSEDISEEKVNIEEKMKVVSPEEEKELKENVEEAKQQTPAMPKEEAQKAIKQFEEKAQNDKIVKEIKLEENEEQVIVHATFIDGVDEQQKNEFILNYVLFLQQAYPSKKIKFAE